MKIGIRILVFTILLIVAYLFMPQSYYVRQALLHGTPDIDDYKLFENRKVIAKSPKPWVFDPDYSKHKLPKKYEEKFNELQTVAYLIVKDSTIFAERYWNECGQNTLVNSFSMAKSIVSLLVGCALDDGSIGSLDQPVRDFLPELQKLKSEELTIRSLLTMSAATDWQEAHSSLFTTTTEAYYGNDLWQLMSKIALKSMPNKEFEYQSGVTQLLAFVLQKAVKMPISEYASIKLWTPLHAENDALWSLDHANGMEKAYCCFNSNARDFARLGQLIINKGRWANRQIVSKSYIDQAISPNENIIRADSHAPNKIYGYQFWILQYKGMQIPYLRGILGQYVFIIPQKNCVVVRLGNKRSSVYSEPNHCPDDVYLWLDAAFEMIGNR